MAIDYKLLVYIYYPVFLLILIEMIRDRFDFDENAFRLQKWTLKPTIFILFIFFSCATVMRSFWHYIPILNRYEYTSLNWDLVTLACFCLFLILIYFSIRYIYRMPIIDVFKLKGSQFPFILKICAVLTVVNMLSIYVLDLNLLINLQDTDLQILKSMGAKEFMLSSFLTIIIAPITEEAIFRGLLYSPLYRKVGKKLAIVLTAFLWSHVHFLPLLPSIGLFIIGLILALLFARSSSLIHPIVFHMFKNGWILVYHVK